MSQTSPSAMTYRPAAGAPGKPRSASEGEGGDHHHVPVPKAAIIAIGALLLASVIMVGLSQLTGLGQASAVTIDVSQRYALVFEDADDGNIVVRDPASGAVVHRFEGDIENGFVRVALRALIFDRKQAGIGPEVPFDLLETGGGRLFLSDPSTGEFVALGAFGGENGQRFVPLAEAADRAGLAQQPGLVTLKGDPR